MERVVIEIPKGDTVRRHKASDGSDIKEFGLIKDYIPINDGVMPVHYGYIVDTKSSEGDEVDALVISPRHYRVGEEVSVLPIALLRREDKDDKIVCVGEEMDNTVRMWDDIDDFLRKLIIDFFGYNYAIVSIEGSLEAVEYIHAARTV